MTLTIRVADRLDIVPFAESGYQYDCVMVILLNVERTRFLYFWGMCDSTSS